MIEKYEISTPSIILTDRDQTCMNALDQMFPDVLVLVCRWHMNRNALAKTRTVLGQVENPNPAPGQDKYENTVETSQFMELYYKAADSPSEDDFVKCCAEISTCNSELADYLDLHRWKYKTKVVRCWTSQYLHFGYRDTSPVEGTHSKCKKWLVSSKGNLLTAFEKLLPWWKTCNKNTSLDIERDVGKVSHILQDEWYSAVVMFISRYALNETANLWKKAVENVTKKSLIEPCAGIFRHSNGRPCVHDLIKIVKSDRQKKLQIQDFHAYWLTRRGITENSRARVLEPAPLQSKKSKKCKKCKTKAHKKNHGSSGTARDVTLSERVDLNHPAIPPTTQPLFTELLMSSNASFGSATEQAPQLPSLRVALNQGQIDEGNDSEASYFQDFLPPRSWGYASRGYF